MSINKSRSLEWLTKHIAVYTAVIWLGFCIYFNFSPETTNRVIAFVALNGAIHWIVDYFTSKINAKLYFAGMNPETGEEKSLHNFFVGIGADQFVHYATLFITAQYILFK